MKGKFDGGEVEVEGLSRHGNWIRQGGNVIVLLDASGPRDNELFEMPLIAKRGAVAAKAQQVAAKVKAHQAATSVKGATKAKPGLTAEKTCWIQTILNNAAGENLVTDGLYGPRTREAVRRFQSRFGLQVDGIVGPRTETALTQAALNQIALASVLPVNGVMDARTRQEIQKFQAANGLVSDGIVGPKTRAGMVVALGGRCLTPLPSGPGPKKPQYYQEKPTKPAGCDNQKFELLISQCRNDAIEAGIGCLEQFGLGASESASILTPFVKLAVATSTIPAVNAITAAIAVFAAAFLTTTEILEAAGCVENVLKNLVSCKERAKQLTGC